MLTTRGDATRRFALFIGRVNYSLAVSCSSEKQLANGQTAKPRGVFHIATAQKQTRSLVLFRVS